eukprot:IDg14110t1
MARRKRKECCAAIIVRIPRARALSYISHCISRQTCFPRRHARHTLTAHPPSNQMPRRRALCAKVRTTACARRVGSSAARKCWEAQRIHTLSNTRVLSLAHPSYRMQPSRDSLSSMASAQCSVCGTKVPHTGRRPGAVPFLPLR